MHNPRSRYILIYAINGVVAAYIREAFGFLPLILYGTISFAAIDNPQAIIRYAKSWNIQKPNFPAAWFTLQFLLNERSREKVFDPSYHDLCKSWARARRVVSKPGQAFVRLAFTVRTALLVINIVHEMALGAAWKRFLNVVGR